MYGASAIDTAVLRPAPRWAEVAARLVSLTTLPSGLWRIAVAFGFTMGAVEGPGQQINTPGWESVYLIFLSVSIEALALLTLGLVRPWGERVPDWIPAIGGRRVAPWAAIAPAAIGALLLTLMWTVGFLPQDGGVLPEPEMTSTGWRVVFLACYAPLLVWGPLLAAVTFDYYRRHCRAS